MFSLIALGLGIVNLVLAAYLRREGARTRALVANPSLLDERGMFFLIPGLGFVFLGMGLLQFAVLFDSLAQSVALTVCVVLALIGFVGLVFGIMKIPYPSRVVPAWARTLVAHRKAGTLPQSMTRTRGDWAPRTREREAEQRREIREARRARKAASAKRGRNRKHNR